MSKSTARFSRDAIRQIEEEAARQTLEVIRREWPWQGGQLHRSFDVSGNQVVTSEKGALYAHEKGVKTPALNVILGDIDNG